MSSDPGIWLAAFLSLAIYSFLYRDNAVYRFAESLLIGVSVGFLLVVAFDTTIMPKAFEPIAAHAKNVYFQGASGLPSLIWVIIPVILGIFMFARFVPSWAWLSRVALALYIGFGAGASIPANMQSYILKQIEGTIRPFLKIGSVGDIFSALFILVGLIAVISYFFFSKAHAGNFGRLARLGTWFLMVFFGATFGYTVMARISLLIGRLQFLLRDWLGLIS
jgi:hypothetical protein